MIGEALFSLFDLRPNCGGRNEDNGNFLQKAPCRHCCTQCPQTSSRPLLTHASTGDSWTLVGKSWSISCGVTVPFPGSSCAQAFVCALQESVSAVLCKFWRLYGGVNGDLLQESLCHTQVCCTQSPCPCGRPLLTCTSAEDTQAQFWLSLCGVSGSWCIQVLFEPSERVWWVWDLILNVILLILLSFWGFSLALARGVSFFGGIQHSPVDSYSAATCSFGVLPEEYELTSFYSTILHHCSF